MHLFRLFTPQAVKALNFALINSPFNCSTFVERLGLRFLFSLFLEKQKPGEHKYKNKEELLGISISIYIYIYIYLNLFSYLYVFVYLFI